MDEHELMTSPCHDGGCGCGGGCDGCQTHEPPDPWHEPCACEGGHGCDGEMCTAPDPWAEDFETYGSMEEEE